MTKQEYADYQATFCSFMQREGLANLSTLPKQIDPYFSHRPCDCCKGLAGMRWDCDGFNPARRKVQGVYSICDDCVYYAEYGQLDDMTMLNITA
jgi:hypothetical protein